MHRNNERINLEKSNDWANTNEPSIACFLNSLARESQSVQLLCGEDGKRVYRLPLANSDSINIPLSYFSSLGSHEYCLPALLHTQDSIKTLSVEQLIEHIVNEPALVGIVSEAQKAIFTKRVLESHRNTEQAIEHSPYQEQLFTEQLDFKTAEQGLLIGHSFHPAPKSREQFSLSDAKLYSPELGGQFKLFWLSVEQSLLTSGSSADIHFNQRFEALVAHDPKLVEALQSAQQQGHGLLPVHPWQWHVMAENPSIKGYIATKQIQNLGQLGTTWYPTSSTRSLYAPGLPYMLKFSLSVKLTNSIRNLSLKEVIRGTRLNDLFQHPQLAQQLGNGQGFQLMQEPAYIGLKDLNGKIIDESLVAFRDNPLMDNPAEEAVVLATLTQQNPYGGSSLVAARIQHYATQQHLSSHQAASLWFDAYCRHAVVPLFHLQANFGIVFLAHQQNIVMQLEQGFPVGMYYRDCQGTGYTDLAFKLFGEQLGDQKEALENYWNQDKVRRYFAYYLIINSTFNLISAICANLDVEESELIEILYHNLNALLQSGVKDDLCLRYVLTSEALCCKGNFFCYLQNFNENSIPDPAVIYFDLPNPLARVEEIAHV
ncbi:IucA/IucC family protein [Vibrio mimicus]|uniref:N(2)-citryl-N(6)-acetyl-N(6)-hydroxylysine synthase n=1 Tax=Vibrio mimicus TaxID=674 RepID=A0A2J9V2F9_VIBMI|nr:IucA/IucC family protein [Vibrio mimicus]EEW10732.1 Aerobactin siderophore biosynthesis protein iucA [Vibrio mimicus VM573]EGU20323.1 aerobactin synthetase [Vibrio mimicus SX-4]KFE31935.1 ferric iron reductase FhuF-like transporter family protein [Vibrio mimicus]PNM57918.1 N(2)-citryl-N(6)-acetyl-N(6)-hydroxylysine synthase [Vibrio mimicus]